LLTALIFICFAGRTLNYPGDGRKDLSFMPETVGDFNVCPANAGGCRIAISPQEAGRREKQDLSLL
jgi:hypothetical protein